MAKDNIKDAKAEYEKELEQELHRIIAELSQDPESIIVKQYSFIMLCGIRRHLNQCPTITDELKTIIDEQIAREIHDCILEIYMYCRTYQDTQNIIEQVIEIEQPAVKTFLEEIQREVAIKRLNALLALIKNGEYSGQLNKYSLEELCELERYLREYETLEPEDRALIDSALQESINHKIGTNPRIYENENAMNSLIEKANPMDRSSIIIHIEDYKAKRFAIQPNA